MVVHLPSRRIPRVLRYSGFTPSFHSSVYVSLTLFARPSHVIQLVVFTFLSVLTLQSRRIKVWALPLSLAATQGISFDFFSCGYLDVSLHHVSLSFECHRFTNDGFPHSDMYGSLSACDSPYLFAAYHVLLRLEMPRLPPNALLFVFLPLFFYQSWWV